MKLQLKVLLSAATTLILMGCATPDRYISDVRLGMNYDEVKDAMGRPFAVRAAKMFEGEEWTDVWEYRAPIWSLAALTDKYDRLYWIIFENGKVVQWGEPGDFAYENTLSQGQAVPIFEYDSQKSTD